MGGLIALTLALLLLTAFILGASVCGDDQDQGGTDTATTVRTNTSATQTATTNTGMNNTVEVPPAPAATPAPAPEPSPDAGGAGSTPLRIIDYAIDPNMVHAGAPLTCMVTVEGTATAVTMGLTGPSGSVSQTVNLTEGTTVGGVTNWTATVAAPAMVGGWRFGATAIAADGTEVIPDAGGLSASLLPFEVIP